jgi:hypothetical protein
MKKQDVDLSQGKKRQYGKCRSDIRRKKATLLLNAGCSSSKQPSLWPGMIIALESI